MLAGGRVVENLFPPSVPFFSPWQLQVVKGETRVMGLQTELWSGAISYRTLKFYLVLIPDLSRDKPRRILETRDTGASTTFRGSLVYLLVLSRKCGNDP